MMFLAVLCEGETEADFVQRILSTHLNVSGISCQPIILGKKVKHDNASAPGGVLNWDPVHRHVRAMLRQYSAPSSYVTTMLDFYAFPTDFPGYGELVKQPDPAKRVEAFEEAMLNATGRNPRFIPYIQLHEFEALLFSRLDELRAEFADDPRALGGIDNLEASITGLAPEQIDQTRAGAPSRRLKTHIAYSKRSVGIPVVERIGIPHLKRSCPHFGAWISQLESLSPVG